MFIKSVSGNWYLFSESKKEILLSNPVLFECYQSSLNNINTADVEQSKEINYYHGKIAFLKENGFLTNKKAPILGRSPISPQQIRKSLENLSHISFEITEECNLACEYCAYSDLYKKGLDRESKIIDTEIVIELINKLSSYWGKTKSLKISFYGGEPLLAFSQIENIISQIKKTFSDIQFSFQITTNGTLLKKHLRYLVDHNIKLIVSLDGDEKQNAYRKFKNGKNSFQRVFENILYIRKEYPQFFEENVQIASVLHSKNDVVSIQRYVKREFGKNPTISSLNTANLNKQSKKKFESIYRTKKGVILHEGPNGLTSINVPGNNDINVFAEKVLQLKSSNINSLINKRNYCLIPAQKTCIPFARKLFLSANGDIYPCETIDQKNPLGSWDSKNGCFNLDVNHISIIYDNLRKEVQEQCASCYISEFCFHCIFNVASSNNGKCNYHYSRKKFEQYVGSFIDYFELDKKDYASTVLAL